MSRAVFMEGESPYIHHRAFGIDLFLSGNKDDVREAIELGCPSGMVTGPVSSSKNPSSTNAVCLALDFDGVLADDASERVYASEGLAAFQVNEVENQAVPANDGPTMPFFMAVAHMQALDKACEAADSTHKRMLRTSIESAHAHTMSAHVIFGVRND